MTERFDPGRALVVVRGRIWGPAGDIGVHLALDTGAAPSLIGRGPLTRIGYDVSTANERTEIATISGTERVPRIGVERLAVLGRQRFGLRVLAHSLPPSPGIDGLIGLEFLRDHRLTIDFRRGIVALD